MSSEIVLALRDAICKLPSLQRPILQKAIDAILERDKQIVALQRDVYRLTLRDQEDVKQHLAEVIR